jgi:HD-GYP domain-containing protein (c-di-GMP phosphodiesterase class II)
MKKKAAEPKLKEKGPHEEPSSAALEKELEEKLDSLSLSQRQSLLYAEELRKIYLKEKEEAERLRQALKDIEETYESTLLALVNALDVREHETHNHSQRVMEYTLEMARKAGIKGQELLDIGRGSLLHDIGKIGLPDSILLKQDNLTDGDWVKIKKHPAIGFGILKGIKFLEGASGIVLTHAEHFDGTGYPKGLKAEAIPVGSRLFSVADTLDAMTNDRPYRKAMGYDAAREEIRRFSGTQFDPWAVEIFLSIPRNRWAEINDKVLGEA